MGHTSGYSGACFKPTLTLVIYDLYSVIAMHGTCKTYLTPFLFRKKSLRRAVLLFVTYAGCGLDPGPRRLEDLHEASVFDLPALTVLDGEHLDVPGGSDLRSLARTLTRERRHFVAV